MTTTEQYLLDAILDDPADDLPRLVYADWLDERGEDGDRERAEFIRCQIQVGLEWLMVRLAEGKEWAKAPPGCQLVWCRGFPSATRCTIEQWMGWECECQRYEGIDRQSWRDSSTACNCRGTGRTPSLAEWCATRWPIERVEFSDALIHPSGGNDTYYVGNLGIFPKEYWRSLENHRTRKSAIDALSDAAVSLGRERAGLNKLKTNRNLITA